MARQSAMTPDNSHTSLMDAFNLRDRGVICLFGGGGKTSLMFSMANALSRAGFIVLTTTTTNIFFPDESQASRTLICDTSQEVIHASRRLLKQSPHICAGHLLDPDTRKVKGFSRDMIGEIRESDLFDWIIVEADGAKQKPIKSSAGHEPVFPACTSHLILVAGLDAVGRPLDEAHVHRARIFKHNTGLSMGEPMTERDISAGLASEINKAVRLTRAPSSAVFLNKADRIRDVENGIRIAEHLAGSAPIDRVIIGMLEPVPIIKQNFSMKNDNQGVG